MLQKYLDSHIVDMTRDIAFKKIFTNKENIFFLAFLISYITKLDYAYVKRKIEFVHPFRGTSNIKSRTGEGDIIVTFDNYLINIEMSKF